jgi:uncharacterized cupin superfamily protein
MSERPIALLALDAPPRTKPSNYPEPFRSMMAGRVKRPLGDLFGLTNFGVNITVVPPGAVSALRHSHSTQDEFVFVVSGTLILETDDDETELSSGMCSGFKAGSGNAHRLLNRSETEAVYLEVGDRTPGDAVVYPDDDLVAQSQNGSWVFTRTEPLICEFA